MTSARRVLLSTFGSAGDLFPLVPIARRLQADGHEVMFAAPRSLGLYLRTLALPSLGLGDGSELGVVKDAPMFTTRFGGWSSFRRIFTRYVAPGLEGGVAQVRSFFEDWRPDVVATMTYGAAARIAAMREDVPHVSVTIYPQFLGLADRGSGGFASAYQCEVRRLCPRAVLEQHGFASVAWGADPTPIVLADPELVGPEHVPAGACIAGYPSWDALPARREDADRAATWIGGRTADVVVVTLGSFVGAAPSDIWGAVRDAVTRCGVRALVVNARVGDVFRSEIDSGRVLSVGFVPLSSLLGGVAGVVHHGGVGTMYGVLRQGLPSAIVPQAFDQPFVAGLAEAAGVAVGATGETLADAMETVLGSAGIRQASQQVMSRLIPVDTAAAHAADLILARADEGSGVQV